MKQHFYMVTVSYIDKIYSQVNQNVFLIFKSAFCTLNNVFTPGHLPTLIEKKEGRGIYTDEDERQRL